jgi:hypothetical protein
VLGERRGVAVVVDEHGQPQPLGHDIGERQFVHRCVDPDDRRGRAAAAIDQRRQAEADGFDRHSAGRGAHLGDRLERHLDQRPLVEPDDRSLCAMVHAELGIDHPGQ